jgi:hypothetical protein
MRKYTLKIIRDNLVIVPTWEVTPVKFATLAFEMVIHEYLPGSFNRWKVVSQYGCSVKYKDMLTGETAYCWLMKNGRTVTDFDAEDKPQGSPFTVFTDGKAVPCNSAQQAARMAVNAIFESIRRPAAIRRAS